MVIAAPQENVAEYPRPPRLEPAHHRIRVLFNGHVVADTVKAFRVLETFHPPTYYIPIEDCDASVIYESPEGSTLCEWKGHASYFDVRLPSGCVATRRVWSYQSPFATFKEAAGHYAFYASPFECYVDDERVKPQPGRFYAGWITSNIIGPIKGVSRNLTS